MFLCAIARPRCDPTTGECIFDGKIGIWPFTERVQAQRSSVNRPAGTWETKPLNVTKEVYKEYFIEKVMPAIRSKWPASDGECVVGIQADNATPHGSAGDFEWECLMVNPDERVSIEQREQPANSPDTNCCDHGFFRALSTNARAQTPATTFDELVTNVQKAFDEYDPTLLN